MSRDAPTIVLVHGLAIVRSAARMFDGIPEALEACGHRVARALVQGDGSLEELADRLWKQLASMDGPLALLCHSFGGLEARTLLLDDTRARRLRAVATLGTPHAGTPLAIPMSRLNRAYKDMTPVARVRWNDRHATEEAMSADRHGIKLVSAIASVSGRVRHLGLVPTQLLLERLHGGPGDGLVPSAAQRWGEVVGEADLDHVECAAFTRRDPQHPRVAQLWARMAEQALAR
jgi:hypothetical protein